MFKFVFAALVFSLSSIAFAENLTYIADYESMSDIDPEVLAECKVPESFTFQTDADTGIADQVFAQMHMWMDLQAFSEPAKNLSLEAEGRNSNYTGEYQETVYLVTPDNYPNQGRVQIDAYGDVNAPKGLVITTEELGEAIAGSEPYPGPNCGEIWYRLEK